MKNKLMPLALVAMLCLNFLFGLAAAFVNNISVERYLSVAEKPMHAQAHLLQQRVQIKFTNNVLTIR